MPRPAKKDIVKLSALLRQYLAGRAARGSRSAVALLWMADHPGEPPGDAMVRVGLPAKYARTYIAYLPKMEKTAAGRKARTELKAEKAARWAATRESYRPKFTKAERAKMIKSGTRNERAMLALSDGKSVSEVAKMIGTSSGVVVRLASMWRTGKFGPNNPGRDKRGRPPKSEPTKAQAKQWMKALERNNGHFGRAAKELGISETELKYWVEKR